MKDRAKRAREASEALRDRLTPQRTLILDALRARDNHIRAEKIYEVFSGCSCNYNG